MNTPIIFLPKSKRNTPLRKMNVGIVNMPVRTNASITLPTLWCTLKTYYEQRGINSTFWDWYDPWIFDDDRTEDEILSMFKDNPPDVLGFSAFIWNEGLMQRVAKRVKSLYPKCLIVFGGPQSDAKFNEDYFIEHPWIDISVPGDAYGELVLTDILDNFVDYDTFNVETVRYCYYPNKETKKRTLTHKGIDKKTFEWPNDIFEAQQDTLIPWLIKNKHRGFMALFETTRGCPYQCTYCDWGGGTFTKTIRKPQATVEKELEWLAINEIGYIFITDANFGMFKRDIEIAEYVISLAKKYQYPKLFHYESAKNHLEQVMYINKILAEARMLYEYKIATQSIDEDIKKNIKRVDIPFDKAIAKVKELQKTVLDLPINIELILGLPGATYNQVLSEIQLYGDHDIAPPLLYIWQLLPEAPAYSKEMREEYQLVTTVKTTFMTRLWMPKPSNTDIIDAATYFTDANLSAENVVGTLSYSPSEWIDMSIAYNVDAAIYYGELRNPLIKYLKENYNFGEADFVNYYISEFIKKKSGIQDLDRAYECLTQFYNNWVFDKEFLEIGIDWFDEFPIITSPVVFTVLTFLVYSHQILDKIAVDLSNKFDDKIIIDICNYVKNKIIDITYDATKGREFQTEYDWLEYSKTGKLRNKLTSYTITDTTVLVGRDSFNDKGTRVPGVHEPLDWNEIQDDVKKVTHYFYRMVANLRTVPKTSQLFEYTDFGLDGRMQTTRH